MKQEEEKKEKNIRWKTDNLLEARAMVNGKTIYVYVQAKGKDPKILTKKEKEKALNEAKRKLEKVIYEAQELGVVPTHIKLQDLMTERVEDRYAKNKLRQKTYGDYVSLIETHIKDSKIGKTEIQKFTVKLLESFYIDKFKNGRIPKKVSEKKRGETKGIEEKTSLSIGTITKLHAIIRASLNYAVKNEYISRNVATLVELPKEEEKKNEFGEIIDEDDYCAFSPGERLVFLNMAKKSLAYLTLLTMMYSGMRVGEALALKWRNVDLEHAEIRIRENFQRVKTPGGQKKTKLVVGPPKTKASRRVIPIPQFLVDELTKLKEKQEKDKDEWGEAYIDKDLVFCIENGNYREPRNLTRSFYSIRNKAGVSPINLHGLRHTYTTMLFEKGVSAKTVSVLLGHTDISVTLNIYSHVFPEIKTEAVDELPDYASEQVRKAFD